FVVAHAGCDATQTASTPVHTFTAAPSNCGATPVIAVAAPAGGATNVATTVDLSWTITGGTAEAIDVYFGTSQTPPLLRAGLAADARTLSLPALAGGTSYFWRVVARSACFAGGVGTVYHRVRALASCDPTKPGLPSEVRSVNVVNAPPNVVFTVQPQAVITGLGERLEDRRGSFTIENIGSAAVSVIVARQELA